MKKLYNCPACNSKVDIRINRFESINSSSYLLSISRGCFLSVEINGYKAASVPVSIDCLKIKTPDNVRSTPEASETRAYSHVSLDMAEHYSDILENQWNSAVDAYIAAKREEFAKFVPVANKQSSGGKRL